VSYPARKYGIKRGDSWDDVSKKSNNTCWAIHLPIIPIGTEGSGNDDNDEHHVAESHSCDHYDDNSNNIHDIEDEFERVFRLSEEEQQRCQQAENGVRRFHHEGKACLERYRLASQGIFKKVLQSLTERLSHGFVLEKASIDEFYLDVSEYCYNCNSRSSRNDAVDNDGEARAGNLYLTEDDVIEKTVIIGQQGNQQQQWPSIEGCDREYDVIDSALRKACQVAYWVRNDVLKDLGFTMSCGISTNKMMAKLAASFGKPNGQAVLHPRYFPNVMAETRITKVRNFGGKLGKEVLKLLHHPTNETASQDLKEFASSATMADLAKVPLPALQNKLSAETAQFVFLACQGIDNEPVNETSGALVKSITAFKSFVASKNQMEINNWLKLLAKEIVDRVVQDSARNHRYPKSCTLNYTYYTTSDGKRPNSTASGSTRSQRQSRSLRLSFPSERESLHRKCESLVNQAMTKLGPIMKDHPLRGVGLSAGNFESRGQPPQGIASIQSFFAVAASPPNNISSGRDSTGRRVNENAVKNGSTSTAYHIERQKMKSSMDNFVVARQPELSTATATTSSSSKEYTHTTSIASYPTSSIVNDRLLECSVVDTDLELAKKLQASYDREDYILTTAASCHRRPAATTRTKSKKTRRIDTFFKKR
jgi:DNA polymerase eta